ncbi:hypothetical protein M758_UG269600 [Ceratodon purpureus]|nr:hypothetical protein M758_UG269600 [Ceratodon purpureus]
MDAIEGTALVHVEQTEFPRRNSEAEALGKLKSAKKKPSQQVERIVDRVWDRFKSVSEFDDRLGVQDLYCAVLLVYNDINKINPGPWNDPPERKEVEDMLKKFDKNHDGKLDRDDFLAFLQSFTKNVSTRISTNILIFSFVLPLLVGATRRFTERLPKVGALVRRIPNVIFSSLVTAAFVMLGTHLRGRALRYSQTESDIYSHPGLRWSSSTVRLRNYRVWLV